MTVRREAVQVVAIPDHLRVMTAALIKRMKFLAYRNNRIVILILINVCAFLILFAPLLLDASGVSTAETKDVWYQQALGWLGRFIGNIVLTIAALFTYIGGMLLDAAVAELVLGMGEKIRGGGGAIEQAINTSWIVIRDVCNILFIFGFVYIGIRTIFDYESAQTKRFLTSLIIGALLINFSLFFSKAIIDVSNMFAVEIYETLIGPSIGSNTTSANQGIASSVAGVMGITTWYKVPDAETFAKLTNGGNFAFYIAGAIFLIIAGFVFAAGGILLIVRFVALILIMIFSPVLFAATVFPQTAGRAKQLWGLLINYSFFAPAYLFLIYISLILMSATQAVINPGNTGFAAAMTAKNAVQDGSITAFGVILNFFIITIFLIASLLIARTLGIYGSQTVIKHTYRAIGASTAGIAARTGRSVVGGRAYNRIQDAEWKEKKSKTWLGRQQIKLTNAAQNASFDVRQINNAGSSLGVGEGKKGGYAGGLAAAQKKEDAFTKLLGKVPDDDIRVKAREQEVKDKEKEIRDLKDQKAQIRDAANATDAEKAANAKLRADLGDDIAKKEDELDKAKDRVEQEKNRMVLGSTYAPANVQRTIGLRDSQIKLMEDDIRSAVKGYVAATTDADRTRFEEAAKTAKENIDKLKKDQVKMRRDAGVDMGYADVVEQRGWTVSLAGGRTRGVNRKVGKELRKKHSKRQQQRREPRSDGGGGGGGPTPAGPTPASPTP